jgi:hypothetical protein
MSARSASDNVGWGGRVAILQWDALRGSRESDQLRLQVLHVCLVEQALAGDEKDHLGPEIFLCVVHFQARAHWIAFTNVDLLAVTRLPWSNQQINARLLKLLPVAHLRVEWPGKNNRFADPV